MTSQVNTNSFNSWTIQDYLSFGYLYLLFIGITTDSIYYGLVGINIISYSSVLDVLLSPIIRLTDNLIFPAAIIVVPLVMHWYVKLIRLIDKKIQAKKGNTDKKPSSKLISLDSKALPVLFVAFGIFFIFMGYGVGGGMNIKGKLKSGIIVPDNRIIFQDGEVSEVKVIGNNSEYIFYIQKKSNVVSVSPIKENIKSIEQLN
ncbi:MAG: hypothetical protein COA74_13915 [Gammaproteobacteria bacterium]|nr:MAG: hypothetical protein COA74_13915 [Gammaproteobacteria bacterium]